MAIQRERSNKEIALKKLLDTANELIDSCGITYCSAGTTVGNFTSITNTGYTDLEIDVSETSVTGIDDFPGADFLMEPGTTIYGNFTSVGIINTYGISALDNIFSIFASNKC